MHGEPLKFHKLKFPQALLHAGALAGVPLYHRQSWDALRGASATTGGTAV